MSILIRMATMTIGALLAQDATTPTPSSPPPAETLAPAPTDNGNARLSADATVDQVLDALHRRGIGLKDFTADVTLAADDPTQGNSTKSKGTAVYQRKGEGDARIRVTFDSKQRGKKVFEEKTEYLLDDGWLVDRDYKLKTEVRRQILRPGEKVDLLKLGEGPFPLPVGQPKERVENLFEVTKILADAKTDPADTVHIRLTPRPDTQFAKKYNSIDVWVGTKTEMPERIQTLDPNEQSRHTTDLHIKAINAGPKDADFTLDDTGTDWNRRSEPYAE